MNRQGRQGFDKSCYQQRDTAKTAQQTSPVLLAGVPPNNAAAVRRNATGLGYFCWRFRYFHESFVEFFFPVICHLEKAMPGPTSASDWIFWSAGSLIGAIERINLATSAGRTCQYLPACSCFNQLR